jgi:hypothetical protein
VPLPPADELEAWFRDWLDEDRPECESGVDLIVALLEDLSDFLDRQGATTEEYERTIAACLHFILGGDHWTPESRRDVVRSCEERLGVTIVRTN